MENSAAWQVLRYHESSKHAPGRYAPGPDGLEWATQPAPFRIYGGVTPVLLPLLNRDPGGGHSDLYQRTQNLAWDMEVESVAAFLELSLGLSAWKSLGEGRWALRINPSSGNLHPTEAHLLLPSLVRHSRQSMAARMARGQGDDLHGGLFHYNPLLHALEPRAPLDPTLQSRLRGHFGAPGFLIGLTSIHWREAWKYGERALRYCHHDVGHALAAMSFAGNLLGWKITYLNAPSDGDLSVVLGLADIRWPPGDAEEPDALCYVAPATYKAIPRGLPSEMLLGFGAQLLQGVPNTLSPDHVDWPLLQLATEALRKPRTGEASVRFESAPALRTAPQSDLSAASLIRRRRSAVAMDGETHASFAQFETILDKTLPRNSVAPFDLELGKPRIHLLLFVHRVVGLARGLYLLLRDPEDLKNIQRSTGRQLLWRRSPGTLPLYFLREGAFEQEATHLSCLQPIAGRGAFSLGMLAQYRPMLERSPWIYKQLFWECGMIGQALYLEAEAQGLRGTGIGCFFDDGVADLIGIQQQSYQSLYHFTVGGPVGDTRLTSIAAYAHLPKDRLPAR